VAPRGEFKRVRVAGLGEPGGGATWPGGRRAAGGSARPGARQGRGERAERVERKRERKNLIEFKFESSSKFSNNTRKFLNTKDVPKFKSYHFCFKLVFI
jgi:hypothetical protein